MIAKWLRRLEFAFSLTDADYEDMIYALKLYQRDYFLTKRMQESTDKMINLAIEAARER